MGHAESTREGATCAHQSRHEDILVILEAHPSYPSTRSYVVKLHRDALPNRIVGRLESIATGKQFPFASGAELLELLMRHADAASAED
jgi:hypothetical protein